MDSPGQHTCPKLPQGTHVSSARQDCPDGHAFAPVWEPHGPLTIYGSLYISTHKVFFVFCCRCSYFGATSPRQTTLCGMDRERSPRGATIEPDTMVTLRFPPHPDLTVPYRRVENGSAKVAAILRLKKNAGQELVYTDNSLAKDCRVRARATIFHDMSITRAFELSI